MANVNTEKYFGRAKSILGILLDGIWPEMQNTWQLRISATPRPTPR